MADILTTPIKFLNSTVLSFNSSLGLGAQESTLSVQLIDDCEVGDSFSAEVGAPAYFTSGAFSFNGIITSWTSNKSGSGKTHSVNVSDPRQLLENAVLVIDTSIFQPQQGPNFFNVYNKAEVGWQNKCAVFGALQGGERGATYTKILQYLKDFEPNICSPTGHQFSIDFTTFPANIPEFYRVTGPSITISSFLSDVCDVLGFEFYVYLAAGNVIKIGLIDMKQAPASFAGITAVYNGRATDISFGRELRNEKTKTLIFGEHTHYQVESKTFEFYFGEDPVMVGVGAAAKQTMVPVIPYHHDECGFWIEKNIRNLQASLGKPLWIDDLGTAAVSVTISEMDIRCAMADYRLWEQRTLDIESQGTLNMAVRLTHPTVSNNTKQALRNLAQGGENLDAANKPVAHRVIPDRAQAANPKVIKRNLARQVDDFKKIHAFLKQLGDTYYGKQYLVKLPNVVCMYQPADNAERLFTDTPTSAGFWAEADANILGLTAPDLNLFRTEDSRVTCFAKFTTTPPEDDPDAAPDDQYYVYRMSDGVTTHCENVPPKNAQGLELPKQSPGFSNPGECNEYRASFDAMNK